MIDGDAFEEGPLRILVVDDDQVDRKTVIRGLRAGGLDAEVTEATDVRSALALLEESFDAVLLDYNLPGGDGARVLRALRDGQSEVPVIVLTGQSDLQTAVGLIKDGASDYLSKNAITPDDLVRSVRNAIRLHRAEAQARDAEVRFRTVQETSPDSFWVLKSLRDAEGNLEDFLIEYANPAAARMTGSTVDKLIGATVLSINPDFPDSSLFGMYSGVLATGVPAENEVHYEREGLDLWLRVTAVRLGDGLAVSAADVSRRKLAELEREQAVAARSRFYAVMSHELRTPINAILGYNDLVLAGVYGSVSEEVSNSIERSQRATRHLLELVNDVLDLSKMEAGKTEVAISSVSITTLLDELLATIQPLAESRNSELTIEADGCDDPVNTDPRRVRQILLNLVSNAIKFGDGKPIRITCQRAGDWMEVAVADSGPGIPEADRDKIFDEFVQLSNASEQGTGLGLPISKKLAELLGGELVVESQEGEGSVFRLRLPAGREAFSLV